MGLQLPNTNSYGQGSSRKFNKKEMTVWKYDAFCFWKFLPQISNHNFEPCQTFPYVYMFFHLCHN